MRCGVTGAHTVFIEFSANVKQGRGQLFSPQQYNNKESLATGRFERLNFEQLPCKSVFKELLLARLHKKNNSRDRDETWGFRDRDSKKLVSRPRPSLETPSLVTTNKKRENDRWLIKSVSFPMTWPSMMNAMDASYAFFRSLALLISRVQSDL